MVQRPRDGGGSVGVPIGGGGDLDGVVGTGRRSSSSVPGYMRATSSFRAKAGRVVGCSAPREPVRDKVAFARAPPCASRVTCSSVMKGSPAAAAGRVCPYTYCSLKGHVHAPVVPLRSFLASERRTIKTQQSVKHKGVPAFRRANNADASGDGFFVEIFAGTGVTSSVSTASSDAGCSDLSTEEMEAMVGRRIDYVKFDQQICRGAEDLLKDHDISVDSSCGCSDVISDGLAEFTTSTKDIVEDEEASVDQEELGSCKSDISELDDNDDEGNICEDSNKETSVESSLDDISSSFGGMNFENVGSDSTDVTTGQRNKLVKSRGRIPAKEVALIRTFNPRAPNILPVEPDTNPEKVDLRHQVTDVRKSTEEWMVDYALRRTVNKLAHAQKRKVEMLVMAFETVLPPVSSEEKSEQDFTETGSWQTCN